MSRLRFVTLTLASTAMVAAVSLAGACSDSSSSGSSRTNSAADGASPGSTSSAAGDIQALGKWCLEEQQRQLEEWAQDPSQSPPEFVHDLGGAELDAAPAAYASGASDIPLSPSKCTRLFVQRENGRVTSETLVRGPFEGGVDPKTYELVYKPAAVTRWTYSADGEKFSADYDGDGFDEIRQTTTYERESVREEHAPGNDVVTARTTAKISDDRASVVVHEEALVDGVMTTTRTVTAPLLQQECNPAQPKPRPEAPATGAWQGPTRECTGTERDAITKLISTALQKGSGCLYAAGMRAESDRVLKTYIRNEARIDCTDDASQKFWAANEDGYMNFFPGKIRLIFYSQLFSRSQTFQEATVGHELFHFFDVHDRDLEAAASEEQLRLSDRVYACEYLCFGKQPTTCHLAACQQKKVSTSWNKQRCEGTVKSDDIGKIEKARGDGVTIAECSTGKQVGALCRSKENGTQVEFCTTEEECNADCEGSCESKSLSCLPDCR